MWPCKIYQQKTCTITWKYKDEESTDSSDNTDHFANVWNKHCDEKSDCDPGCSQSNTGPALVRPSHCCVFVSSPQQRILNHRSTDVSINQYTVCARNYSPNSHKTVCCKPSKQDNDGVDGDDWDSKQQPGNDHGHITPAVRHQNIRSYVLPKRQIPKDSYKTVLVNSSSVQQYAH